MTNREFLMEGLKGLSDAEFCDHLEKGYKNYLTFKHLLTNNFDSEEGYKIDSSVLKQEVDDTSREAINNWGNEKWWREAL